MKKVVLFDIDGTLINSGSSGLRALDKAIKDMGGPDNICNFFELQGSTDKVNFTNAFKCAFKRNPSGKEYSLIKKLYLKHLPEEVEYSVKNNMYFKIKGIKEFLKKLSEYENVVIGLGTGNVEKGAYIKLKPSGLSEYFLFGGFGDTYEERHKMLKKAVKSAEKIIKSKINPLEVYVIGDTSKDVIAAKECYYHSAVVLDGFGDNKKILKSGPELIEKDFTDLGVWLMWLGLEKDPKGVERFSYICPDTPIEHAHFGMTGILSPALKSKKLTFRKK
jgi:phosphoglycolate phosphatase